MLFGFFGVIVIVFGFIWIFVVYYYYGDYMDGNFSGGVEYLEYLGYNE